MAPPLAIPAELVPAFRQFARDFDRVTAAWVAAGEETPASVATAREGVRAYLADEADPDAYGVARLQRLRQVFAWWRERAAGGQWVGTVAVQPVLSDAAEARLADVWWKRRAR